MSARLLGTARVPGDKSTAHRALVLAALARGESEIEGAPGSEDVAATRRAVEALGAQVREDGRVWRVRPPGEWRGGLELDAGNSGTTARLLAGALSARRCAARIVGDASLSRRPMERVAEPLRALGARVSTSGGGLPLTVEPAELRPAEWSARVPSAQVKTAFLLAALGAEGWSEYREPVPTRDHGERLLEAFGAELEDDGAGRLRLLGGSPLSGARVRVAGDPSSAAVLLTAAVLLPGSRVRVQDVDESPTRRGFVRVLQRMGAALEEDGPALAASASTLNGVRVAAAEVPGLVDEVPLLVLAAARAAGGSVFEGLGELRHKESDRLGALTALLADLGVSARLEGEDLHVEGGGELRAVPLAPRGDHRLAMLGAVLALLLPGAGCGEEPCVAVSWPSFYDDLRALLRPGAGE